jgi:uracil-DNA glycosylase family 4
MAENPQNEFSALIGELREQILYLQELGVSDFDVALPEVQIPKLKAQSSQSNVQAQKLERFVPTDLPVAPKSAPKNPNPLNASPRQSILEKSKLSRLPSLAKRNSETAGSQSNKIQEPPGGEEMPRKLISAQEPPTSPLFGDITPTLPEATETLEDIRLDIGNCTRCPLWEGRTKIVHSEGNAEADLVFVGEAPGANEDAEGRPFVGKAGQLLNKIIEAIGMKREDVFIGNINRCRPPGNRQPTLPEAHTCRPFLLREITVVRPKIIVVLGNTATQNLLDTKVGITKLRGEFQDYYGVKVMPTFHPAYLLRDPSKKRETWEDMKKVRDELNKMK